MSFKISLGIPLETSTNDFIEPPEGSWRLRGLMVGRLSTSQAGMVKASWTLALMGMSMDGTVRSNLRSGSGSG